MCFQANRFLRKKIYFEGQKDVMPGARQIFKQIFHVILQRSDCCGRFIFFFVSAGVFDFLEGICVSVSGAENSPLASDRKSLYILSEKRIKVTTSIEKEREMGL